MLCGVGLNGTHRAMTEYTVALERSADLTDEECRQRLSAAYRIILECARREERKADEGQARAEGEG